MHFSLVHKIDYGMAEQGKVIQNRMENVNPYPRTNYVSGKRRKNALYRQKETNNSLSTSPPLENLIVGGFADQSILWAHSHHVPPHQPPS